MNKDLKNYVKIYKNNLNINFCNECSTELDKVQWKQHTFHNSKNNTYVSYEKELFRCKILSQ